MFYCDLHSGNILEYYWNDVKISDLGLSQFEIENDETKGIFEVIPYITPEILRREKFTTATTGKLPFHDRSHDYLLVIAILDGKRPEITIPHNSS
ncbi:hypothetical protein G9A89_014717 [Geosiphon pyriformis]|nr:hypothetical protein G9A89_014717 [Geosiphon pyriformis]